MNEKKDSIGALWKNKSAKGAEYLSGQIEINGAKIKIVGFINTYKDAENKPDWKIYLSDPREGSKGDKYVDNSAPEDDSLIPF